MEVFEGFFIFLVNQSEFSLWYKVFFIYYFVKQIYGTSPIPRVSLRELSLFNFD